MEKKQPLVSIVVPLYNAVNYLAACVESIVSQTYDALEIIIVNDGSTDGSGNLSDQLAEKDARIRVVHQINRGVSEARNVGIAQSKGEFLTFVDADDMLKKNVIELAVNIALSQEKAEIVIWRYKKFSETSFSNAASFMTEPNWINPLKNTSVNGVFQMEYPMLEGKRIDGWKFIGDAVRNELFRRFFGPIDRELHNPLLQDSNNMSWGKLYHLELLRNKECRFIDTQKIGSEDQLFVFECLWNAKSVVWLDYFGYFYRKDNSISITKSYGNTLFKRYSTLNDYLDMYYQKNIQMFDVDGRFRQALSNRQALNILNVCLSLMYRGYQASSWDKYKQLNQIFGDIDYRKRLKKLELGQLSLGFRAFYGSARLGFTAMGFVLLKLMLWVNRRSN